MNYAISLGIACLWVSNFRSLWHPLESVWSVRGFWGKLERVVLLVWLVVAPFICLWIAFG